MPTEKDCTTPLPIGYLIKVLCGFIKAQSHITVSILICWQNITLETFMLGYTFYISYVLGQGRRESSAKGGFELGSNASKATFKHFTPYAIVAIS